VRADEPWHVPLGPAVAVLGGVVNGLGDLLMMHTAGPGESVVSAVPRLQLLASTSPTASVLGGVLGVCCITCWGAALPRLFEVLSPGGRAWAMLATSSGALFVGTSVAYHLEAALSAAAARAGVDSGITLEALASHLAGVSGALDTVATLALLLLGAGLLGATWRRATVLPRWAVIASPVTLATIPLGLAARAPAPWGAPAAFLSSTAGITASLALFAWTARSRGNPLQ
jgi:hypothetical protein